MTPQTPHPVFPTANPIGKTPDGRLVCDVGGNHHVFTLDQLVSYVEMRERNIVLSETEPLTYGVELSHWKDADDLLKLTKVLCIFGGNRASKTEFCIKRAMQMLVERPKIDVLFLQNNELSSKQLHQKAAWKYMPAAWKNLKRHHGGNIKYDPKNGFSDQVFVTPKDGTAIFGNYGQDLDKYEGLSFDLIVADENLPLKWYLGLLRGLATRGGLLLWPFTPIAGMTPAINEVIGGASTLQSLPVDPVILDPSLRHVDDCPVGHMPYIQKKGKVYAIYFHSNLNPFSPYQNLVDLYGDKDKSERERRFYGYARKLVRVAFPKFGEHNIATAERMRELLRDVPVTRYHVADPASARNMFQLWVGVDARGRHLFYREWPDLHRFGEWAVQSDDAGKWDGDPGPAQPTLGYGVVDYKTMILTEEGNRLTDSGWEMCGESVFQRIMDPRSGAVQSVAERDGGLTLIDRFMDAQANSRGVIVGPSLEFMPAPGFSEGKGVDGNEEGVQGINDLLAYDDTKPIEPIFNEPRLIVSEDCANLIWALRNYTGNDRAKAACKDPIDCLRYIATSNLEYYPDDALVPRGGGSY